MSPLRAWLLVGAVAISGCAAATRRQPAVRPNVLVVLTDDQRWDSIGAAGNELVDTPEMDRLAHDGIRFANAFVTTPICAASRASILTGTYESAHDCTFGSAPLRAPLIATSYPARLRAAGYRTGFVGKFGVTATAAAPKAMFDVYEPLQLPYVRSDAGAGTRHLTEVTTDRAIAFLAAADPARPWCLSISFHAPHAVDGDPQQYSWTAANDGAYANVTWPVPATMTEAFFGAQPEFLRGSESRVRFGWRFDEPAKYQRMVTGYHRMIRDVDVALGRLRRELAARGMADDTVIVFLSDNGYFLGERGFAGKWYGYEPSLRVPMIVFDPRAPQRGRVVAEPVLNVDVAPTVLGLAGLEPGSTVQGESLLPWIVGSSPSHWRQEFLFEHRYAHARIPKSEGIRGARFTYIRWYERSPPVEELYDRDADPDQTRNLAGDPACAATLEGMRRQTDALRDRFRGR